jgi:DNA-binding transcriptional regulator WhiA
LAEKIEQKIHRKKLSRLQRLINLKIANAYRTVSNEALSINAELIPIHIKIKETAELHKTVRGRATRTYKLTTIFANNGFIQ